MAYTLLCYHTAPSDDIDPPLGNAPGLPDPRCLVEASRGNSKALAITAQACYSRRRGNDTAVHRRVVKACGNIVVDWYALDVGQGELTFAQLYEGLVAASMMKASGEQGQQEWMFPAYAGTGSTQQCSNNNTVAQYYYSARLKSGVMKTMLPLVCWNCGEEETLPILAEKTQLHTRQ
ncbi:hypothetical protein Bbelb_287980 [Branchiostoma belcheri]|nr:hypothetical protein Bbelb_287980 [Branchiostoma belcheri]